MKIEIPEYAAAVLRRLWKNGYEAYVVGGCVRDCILSVQPNDWDVATSAKPDRILELFSTAPEFHAIPTGIMHGTVTVIAHGQSIEVTTYRVDGDYADHRRPDKVSFTESLIEDLSRRDFTINAMAYAPVDGLCDPFDGAADLAAKTMRCVGDPMKRFSEDALRILRMMRFSSVLGFSIEEASADAAIELRDSLRYVSRERIASELAKLLCGKDCARVVSEYYQIVQTVFPETKRSDWGIIRRSLEALHGESLSLMLAALLAECENVREMLGELRFDKKTSAEAQTIATYCHGALSDKLSVKRLCRDIGAEMARSAILLGIARGEISEDPLKFHDEIRENGECISLPMLNINGNTLRALGVSPKEIGKVLDALLDGVMRAEIANEPEALCCAARHSMKGIDENQ